MLASDFWNWYVPVGAEVIYTHATGERERTSTRSEAWTEEGAAVVRLIGCIRPCPLARITLVNGWPKEPRPGVPLTITRPVDYEARMAADLAHGLKGLLEAMHDTRFSQQDRDHFATVIRRLTKSHNDEVRAHLQRRRA